MSRLVFLLACGLVLGVTAAPVHGDVAREAIDAANAAFVKAFLAGDAETVSELYTEDAQVIAPGAEVARGRAAIARFWGESMKSTRDVKLETATVESHGDLAFEDGVVHLVATDGSKTSARYVVVWKRAGGRWRIHRDIWNGGPAAAP
jgi:uncharacterized protein (TIGR02246 family)